MPARVKFRKKSLVAISCDDNDDCPEGILCKNGICENRKSGTIIKQIQRQRQRQGRRSDPTIRPGVRIPNPNDPLDTGLSLELVGDEGGLHSFIDDYKEEEERRQISEELDKQRLVKFNIQPRKYPEGFQGSQLYLNAVISNMIKRSRNFDPVKLRIPHNLYNLTNEDDLKSLILDLNNILDNLFKVDGKEKYYVLINGEYYVTTIDDINLIDKYYHEAVNTLKTRFKGGSRKQNKKRKNNKNTKRRKLRSKIRSKKSKTKRVRKIR